jgi:hypothetical protein
MQVSNDSNVSLLISQDKDIVLLVDVVIRDSAAVVWIETLLIFERNAVSA